MSSRILKSMVIFSVVLLLIGQTLAPVRAESKPAEKASLTYKTVLTTMKTINDAAGSWMHQGGRLYKGTTLVGNFVGFLRRTTGGTEEQKVAFAMGTAIFLGTKPPQNMTIQGVCDLTTGKFIGSVSAASSTYKTWIGAQVQGDDKGNLTITK